MTLLLDNSDLEPLISAREFIGSLDAAYRSFSAGDGVCAPRIDVQSGETAPDTNYQLGLAVGMSGKYAALRIKSDVVMRQIIEGVARKNKYSVRPGTYMGLVLLFDRANGALLAIMHDGLLQKMRVGADSALGVRYMAREDARVLGILGSGGMARAHVAAIAAVRPLQRIQVFSPTRKNREEFAREMTEMHGVSAVAVAAPEAAYTGADIISSCASAIGPVIFGEHLTPGMHVTCIGGTLDAVANAKVDKALRFGLAPAPSELPHLHFEDECLTFAQAGGKAKHGGTGRYAEISADRRISFAELLAQPGRGRANAEEITFSERGNIHGIQFAAVAGLLFERAQAANVGQELPPDLFLQSIRN
jgi:ornithine cyclodeaminase/alanine dehydrogenase-like protein (mu-crystallin family)